MFLSAPRSTLFFKLYISAPPKSKRKSQKKKSHVTVVCVYNRWWRSPIKDTIYSTWRELSRRKVVTVPALAQEKNLKKKRKKKACKAKGLSNIMVFGACCQPDCFPPLHFLPVVNVWGRRPTTAHYLNTISNFYICYNYSTTPSSFEHFFWFNGIRTRLWAPRIKINSAKR